MFADDNYGNIMQVLDPEEGHPGGAGIYYHADCGFIACVLRDLTGRCRSPPDMEVDQQRQPRQAWVVPHKYQHEP
jgi:hypothetical protein